MTQQVKLSSFYGGQQPRPYLLMDSKTGEAVTDRVEKPSVNEGLMEWASKVPFGAGGTLLKPDSSATTLPKARNELQIFSAAKSMDILAANPNLLSDFNQNAFKIVASLFWKENLTDDERQHFRDLAAEERRVAAEAMAALEASDPRYKAEKEKAAHYRKAKANIASSARAAAGPLGPAVRRAHATTANKKNIRSNKPKKAKVPLSLRVVVEKRPSKNLNGVKRSKAGAAAAAAPAAAGGPSKKVSNATKELAAGYTNDFELIPAASPKEQRVTRSGQAVNKVSQKKTSTAAPKIVPLLRTRSRKAKK